MLECWYRYCHTAAAAAFAKHRRKPSCHTTLWQQMTLLSTTHCANVCTHPHAPVLPSKPSISVSSWLSVCSRSSLPPPIPVDVTATAQQHTAGWLADTTLPAYMHSVPVQCAHLSLRWQQHSLSAQHVCQCSISSMTTRDSPSAPDVTSKPTCATAASDGINFINKHQAGCILLGLLEQVPHTACSHTHKHLHKLRARDGEEGHTCLSCNGLGQQGLTSTWGGNTGDTQNSQKAVLSTISLF